jgi:hypothetical protein
MSTIAHRLQAIVAGLIAQATIFLVMLHGSYAGWASRELVLLFFYGLMLAAFNHHWTNLKKTSSLYTGYFFLIGLIPLLVWHGGLFHEYLRQVPTILYCEIYGCKV